MTTSISKDLLDKLLKRRSELEDEAIALDQIISVYRRLLSEDGGESRDDEQHELYEALNPRARHAAQIAEMMEAVRRIIISEKRPMKRGELVRRLEKLGYVITGGDKNKVFGTNMWRSKKFITVGTKGYWPADVDLPSL